jgi:hypothetical protein
VGSVLGIWIFAAMAFLQLSPGYWFVAAIAGLAAAPPFSRRLGTVAVAAAVGVVLLLQYSDYPNRTTYWSPYQKLEVEPSGDGQYSIFVNNIGYMGMSSMTTNSLRQNACPSGIMIATSRSRNAVIARTAASRRTIQ